MKSKHAVSLAFFNRLITDVKLKVMGKQPYAPITMERMNEATQHLAQIEQCKEPIIYR